MNFAAGRRVLLIRLKPTIDNHAIKRGMIERSLREGKRMAQRRLFNIAYFTAAVAVFSWMLRDNPHMRFVPIASMLLCAFYGLLAVTALAKPNGFALGQEVLSVRKQRSIRRLALLIPLPALLYFSVYSACLEQAGENRCLNRFFGPIARFEKASFSRARMVDFVAKTHPRILAAAQHYESKQDWRAAESYYKAATKLENNLYGRRMPSSYAIMGSLYEKMGRKDKAEKLFLKAERLANTQFCARTRICKYGEIVSVPHMLHELSDSGLTRNEIETRYPWLADYRGFEAAPASVIGRQFLALNSSWRQSHDWCENDKRGHQCKDQASASDENCGDDNHSCKLAALTASCNDDCKDMSHSHDQHSTVWRVIWNSVGTQAGTQEVSPCAPTGTTFSDKQKAASIETPRANRN